MKNLTTANHSQLEKVGTLTKGESVITIWRKMETTFRSLPQYFVKKNGELRPFKAFEETENWMNPVPSLLEEWIEKKMETREFFKPCPHAMAIHGKSGHSPPP